MSSNSNQEITVGIRILQKEKDNNSKFSVGKDGQYCLFEDKTEETQQTSSIEDVIYPMYIPANTYLTGQNIVSKENGERVILTFSGEKPFVFVQETSDLADEMTTVSVYGEPLILTDTIGALSDNSVSWNSNNIEYYLISDSLSQEELVSIVRSVSVMPVSK